MSERLEKTLLIVNKLGLHARAATQLVKLANQFEAEVTIVQDDKSASASSVLGLMMLESCQGKEIQVISEGKDAQQAMDAVEELIVGKFNESE
ncbi:MAG: HPr family phosphocarrier protein [Alteromonadaceae bacterium]|jgi:phosphocarrier protein NPr|uniref:Phosphocarrier protein HPr n=2 Tax=Paraglaciecola mesophila TaxID=197222 RepID=K6Z2L2_9ALTE|nr:HPr family phosphocarrier protein [Paraglaciecola mesophila]MAD15771.1 HPr family phosphocarrier protein [Alteromonadaceae bacterium]MBB18951.1 HPr family phosphocarrier protein [Rickettsiales bacterium]GAC24627.1 phosphocarrier protein HPr [Paraglaciecola mesophila KMM 241]|tara:strand:+ start:7537 stop:7815 length:279 start_codon:yes stop_codon:yes gene_type:complete